MTIVLKSQTLAGLSSRHATSTPWPESLMKNGASASIFIWPYTSCVAIVSNGTKIKLRRICPWQCFLPCILSMMLPLQRESPQQSENICLHYSAKRTRTSFLPGLYARVPSPSCQRTVQSIFFRHALSWVTVPGLL